LSFPLVGNLFVSEERFWTSQNDRTMKLKQLLKYLMINNIINPYGTDIDKLFAYIVVALSFTAI